MKKKFNYIDFHKEMIASITSSWETAMKLGDYWNAKSFEKQIKYHEKKLNKLLKSKGGAE